MNIIFSKTLPTETGQYLIHWKIAHRHRMIYADNLQKCVYHKHPMQFETITIRKIPEVIDPIYGKFPEHSVVVEWMNSDVTHIKMDMVEGISQKLT